MAMNLLVQDFLRTYGDDRQKALGALEAEYAVNAKFSERHPNLVLLKYDMIESQMGRPLVQECRGLILNSGDNWRIISFPFRKFFNYEEVHAAKLDWSTARVQEKLDGSLMVMYHYAGCWNVSTSGTPDASGRVGDNLCTFKELFWDTFDKMEFPLDMMDEEATYMFELTSPYNKVVVPHAESSLSLIGVNYCVNGDWEEGFVREYPEFNPVREFKLTSIDSVVESFASIDGMRQEGYVVVDGNFNRIKVKHPRYVLIHHMKDGLASHRNLIAIVQNNETSEVESVFPELKGQFDSIRAKIKALRIELESCYNKISHIPLQRDFALEALKSPLPDALFRVRSGKITSFANYLEKLPSDQLAAVLSR
jgi:hypothetical protein